MKMTRKGLKMNISKCLKNYDMDKSDEQTTDVRGKHEFTNGYRFMDVNYEHPYVIMFWEDSELAHDDKMIRMRLIHEILKKHGFSEYLEMKKNLPELILKNFRD